MRELFRLFVTDDANARNFHRMRPAEQTREFSEVCSLLYTIHPCVGPSGEGSVTVACTASASSVAAVAV